MMSWPRDVYFAEFPAATIMYSLGTSPVNWLMDWNLQNYGGQGKAVSQSSQM